MEQALDALDLAIEVIIVASLITILMSLAYLGVSGNDATTNSLQYYYSKDAYFDYNGSVIDGSTAIYLAETVAPKGDVLVKFYTKKCPTGFISTEGIKDIRNVQYIDPSKDYICNTIKDTSDVTVSLQIIEVGTNLYEISEENLTREIRKLEKANRILIELIENMNAQTQNYKTIDTSGLSIDMNTMNSYKNYMFYFKMQEFYTKWRAEI